VSRASLIKFDEDLAARVAPGPGDAILWLHGYTLDSSSWSELWNLLPDWHHIGIDLPGHGCSLPLPPQEDLPALARRIGRLALDRDVQHIVALSFGTLLALQIVIEFPESFQSLTLGAPALGGGPQDAEVGTRYGELAGLYHLHGFTPELRKSWMQSPPNIFKGAEAHPELWARLWKIVGKHPWWELEDQSYSRLSNHPQSKEELQLVQAATLLLVGENELSPFKRCAELIRRAIPDCRREYIPVVGHLCMLENAPAVSEILQEHWRSHQHAAAQPALSGGFRA
jgi:pimeloyl-ACP methyl ester carboxylesterase